jgi:hypothetical protein
VRTGRFLSGAISLALIVTGVAGLGSPAASAARPAPTTRVAVSYLGLADFSVSASVVQAALPPGFSARPCFGGSADSADVFVVATEETYLDLRKVPAQPARSLSLLTCADGPAGYARSDATEPPWYRLRAWSDSPSVRSFLAEQNLPADPVTMSFTGGNHAFSFEAVDPAGHVLAAGTFATPALPVPTIATCAPAPSRGRLVAVSTDGQAAALDWDKVESTCLAVSSLSWDQASPLSSLLGSGNQALFSFVSDVHQATYTFRRQLP